MKWQDFVESLVSEGGKLFVLIIMLFWLMGVMAILHFVGRDPGEEGKLLVSNAFTALFSTLIARLK
jgi:hypothetical protein